ncbi:universal stress protein UspA-like protein [Desulfosporosinus orientis DSM 765]|uniref:Universal stress protein UspA-like protein n=1 Tax=Desulfosporosinus orientis (strain ATCC 19365 / DSM 765 / NCIMB 8382 / VKM B-1628 / Singapore I) TaxID=768706 RepID=G7WE57_DESOD|nr:universal stress protein [Desulfosporosinus orientis]AET70033.1 universal stress protein UspA-like protein [Desulfosporosinus orientis DSM 765]
MYRRIVVPVDSSALSRRALEYALELCKGTGAELTVVYINPIIPSWYGGSIPERCFTLLEAIGTEESLNNLLSDLDVKSLSISKKTAAGNPVTLIIGMAKEEKANLIVMGSRGFNWLTGLLLGSVSQWVIKYAPCPVLIVK